MQDLSAGSPCPEHPQSVCQKSSQTPGLPSGFDRTERLAVRQETSDSGIAVQRRATLPWVLKLQNRFWTRHEAKHERLDPLTLSNKKWDLSAMEKPPGHDYQGRAIKEKAKRRGSSGQIGGFSEQGFLTYEQRLTRDPRWALSEGSRHFEEKSAVFEALHKITNRLKSMGVPYAVAGGLALFQHGLRRFTEDVDILVTKDDLRKIHDELEGLGYLPPYAKSKHLRDTALGVKIEFLTTGEYPGDGKEKPVSFPDPTAVNFNSGGVHYLNLPTLVELKLASGMTDAGRMKDLSDVLELIKILTLPANFTDQLNPFVRAKYLELWNQGKKRYETLWRNKWLTSDAKTIDDMIAALRAAADDLDEMRKAGVTLEDSGGVGDDYAILATTDPEVAKQFGMEEGREYLDEDDDEDEALDAAT